MQDLPSPQEEIKRLLAFVSKNEASDLHLKVGYRPVVRIGGTSRASKMEFRKMSERTSTMVSTWVSSTLAW